MRDLPVIWDKWLTGGPFVGESAPRTVVTVQPDWWLRKSGLTVGTSKRGPFRYWQCAANDQTEIEVPNVSKVDIDRSVETDAASCTIEIYNQKMDYSATDTSIGKPGYYTWNYGESDDAVSRWGHAENEWNDILVPNALLRTYQGYGLRSTSWETAVSNGEIALSGVWLIDEVSVGTSGILQLRCRDMGKLLIEQQIYKPLVPTRLYPEVIDYCRWYYKQYDAAFDERPPETTPGYQPANEVGLEYLWSSGDAWYGFNALIHGHRPTDSLDGRADTFALSVGNSHPSKDFCTDYFEYRPGGPISGVYISPWGGNYTVYISVMENGAWVDGGGGLVPYDPAELYLSQPTVDTGADIPYVLKTGIAWEAGSWIQLPREFNAQKLRITFRNHTQSPWGPWYYRCGIREIKAGYGVSRGASSKGVDHIPWVFGFDSHPTGSGYWCVDEAGKVFAFGDCRPFSANGSDPQAANVHDDIAVAIRATQSGNGYWVLLGNGRVKAYGDAVHYNDASGAGVSDFIDMAPTRTGLGYYLLRRDGTVYARGDAVHYGNATGSGLANHGYIATSIETHPTLDGYWTINGNGVVETFGSVPDHGSIVNRGNFEDHEWTAEIRATADGGGYWIIGGAGHIHNFGNAQHHGEPLDPELRKPLEWNGFRRLIWSFGRSNEDEGYWVVLADGTVLAFGNADYFGSPGTQGTIRTTGNYTDYSDIIRELLLWSGWLLCAPSYPANEPPPVFGNIETTGAYAEECLPKDMFDKHPVIDAINAIKEIVGYLFWIDDEGAARFESPNWWSIGNFYDDGTRTDFLPEIDERTVLTDYNVNFRDEDARSYITIASEDVDNKSGQPVVTTVVPETARLLRGMVKPAIWTNGAFTNQDEQRIMAELIALHVWFSMRTGSVTCLANPALQINDQVRIFERTTGETYVHYIRGMSTSHNLETGEYLMTLETHWLGTEDNWVITRESIPTPDDETYETPTQVQISELLAGYIERLVNRQIDVVRPLATTRQVGPTIPDGTAGAANG